jgi:hypothetical protein
MSLFSPTTESADKNTRLSPGSIRRTVSFKQSVTLFVDYPDTILASMTLLPRDFTMRRVPLQSPLEGFKFRRRMIVAPILVVAQVGVQEVYLAMYLLLPV